MSRSHIARVDVARALFEEMDRGRADRQRNGKATEGSVAALRLSAAPQPNSGHHPMLARIERLLDRPLVAWSVLLFAGATWLVLACWSAAGFLAPDSCGPMDAVLSPASCAS